MYPFQIRYENGKTVPLRGDECFMPVVGDAPRVQAAHLLVGVRVQAPGLPHEGVIERLREPRELTAKEIRDQLLQQIRREINICEQHNHVTDVKGKLEMLAYRILTILDGRYSDAYSVVTQAAPELQERRRQEGLDWCPAGVALGCLHEPFLEKNR